MKLRVRLRVAGVDEAGRGPLAGPVVAAAVILNPQRPIRGLADSKALEHEERVRLARLIRERALCYAVAWADAVRTMRVPSENESGRSAVSGAAMNAPT